VPDSVSLVIANSVTPSAKLLTLGTRYNKRVVECRFAVALIAIKTGLCTSFDDCTLLTLQELQVALGKTLDEMSDLAKEHLKKGGYTKQMLERDGNTEDPFAMVGRVPHIVEVMTRNAAFYPHERAVHVYNEAKRVYDFAAICKDTSLEEEDKVKKLGELMNKSHMSCNVLYDCSSEQLNELTSLARSAGALGSRLTGAGWGGCCVSLVRKSELITFVDKVMDFYTKEREDQDQLWITDDLKRYIFGTQLGRGALVLDPQFCVWAA
jgi:N-acetylgalactosamine kinase